LIIKNEYNGNTSTQQVQQRNKIGNMIFNRHNQLMNSSIRNIKNKHIIVE
jgi:hypothetical protein